MFILLGILKSYILLLFYICHSKISANQGIERQGREFLTDENSQTSSYFFYQHPHYPKDCKEIGFDCISSTIRSSGTFLIQPEGYDEPFEVYCNNGIDGDGWTVILRRSDGSLNFNRSWENYKSGFGFLSSEFWLGYEKLSYLTNQAEYEIRIDLTLYNGSTFFIKYNSFRVTDEWSDYGIVSVGSHSGNASLAVSECPPNMIFGNISCQLTCDNPTNGNICPDPQSSKTEVCVCADGFLWNGDACVPPSQCGCFVTEADLVIPNNETYVDSACSKKCSCQENQLTCNSNYECSPNAACDLRHNVRQCFCKKGYDGDGETCVSLYKDCYDAYVDNRTQNGVYTIQPNGWPGQPFNVYCDMSTSGGGWTVFLRRGDMVTDFHRNWTYYRNGFGSVQQRNDFWLGNEQLYYLTNNNQRRYKLRIDIVTSDGSPKYDEYASFRTDGEDTKYRLVDLGGHSGTAANGMCDTSGRQFSTYDDDNDQCGNHNCADKHRGAWWYAGEWCSPCAESHCYHFQYSSSCHTYCSHGNLNGDYNGRNGGEGIFWGCGPYYCNLNSAEMKIRPVL